MSPTTSRLMLVLLIISQCSRIAQGKTIYAAINVENSTSEISAFIENDGNSSSITPLPDNEKAFDTETDVEERIGEISAHTKNDDNSTLISSPDNECLPVWAWNVLWIMSAFILCCFCCCPQILGQILGCPFCCVIVIVSLIISIIFSLLKLCLSILENILTSVCCGSSCSGFNRIGPRTSSFATGFRSMFHGDKTSSRSSFKFSFQSFKVHEAYQL